MISSSVTVATTCKTESNILWLMLAKMLAYTRLFHESEPELSCAPNNWAPATQEQCFTVGFMGWKLSGTCIVPPLNLLIKSCGYPPFKWQKKRATRWEYRGWNEGTCVHVVRLLKYLGCQRLTNPTGQAAANNCFQSPSLCVDHSDSANHQEEGQDIENLPLQVIRDLI